MQGRYMRGPRGDGACASLLPGESPVAVSLTPESLQTHSRPGSMAFKGRVSSGSREVLLCEWKVAWAA